jgi:hypothetical protein
MLDLKRGPQDPILPIRATKRPRTTALYSDRPTASQNEGLLSHWISSLVTLTHKAATGIFTERLLSFTVHIRTPFHRLFISLKGATSTSIILANSTNGRRNTTFVSPGSSYISTFNAPTPQEVSKNANEAIFATVRPNRVARFTYSPNTASTIAPFITVPTHATTG